MNHQIHEAFQSDKQKLCLEVLRTNINPNYSRFYHRFILQLFKRKVDTPTMLVEEGHIPVRSFLESFHPQT